MVGGIPRLLSQDFYWGEIEKADARRLVDEARDRGWKNAVSSRFEESDAAWISILDWQRASWIPLLALPLDSVVLDIGSGYGAITHALATSFREVHSVEAIAERVDFTHERLSQEGCDNVHLVQGSALQLPYPPASFDAIIVNGVLEWIGDWDLEGSPRAAQLRFLNRLHMLLKPGGRLLVGIENRIGYPSVTGAIDHSGLPYTNLLPRPLATAALRLFANRHHRMEAPSRSYRTYTYSESGYRRLFRAAKFERTDTYWAEPGYNLPYRLVPLTADSVAENLVAMQTEASVGKRLSISARVKRALADAGLFERIVPEFVFIVRKNGVEETPWHSVLPPEVARAPEFWLTTQKFGTKTTIRAFNDAHPGVILKCSTPAPGSDERIAAEYAQLEAIAGRVAGHREPLPFEVPAPLGLFVVGHRVITVESRSPGDQISTLLYQLPLDRQLAFLRAKLGRLANSAASIATLAHHATGTDSAASWIQHAKPVIGPVLAAKADAIHGKYSEFSGHGDFTIENVLLDLETDRMTVIDWEYVRGELPPLYDLFTMYLQLVNAIVPPPQVAAMFDDPALARFYTAFFHANEWSALFRNCTSHVCKKLMLDPSRTWEMFVDSLILRIGYLIERKSVFSVSREGFIKAMLEWEEQFQL
ncbi:MAG: methyltransferase domain-containing protein [bacterium]